jgi:hypothetical protein
MLMVGSRRIFPRIGPTTRGVTFELMTHELPHRVGEPLQVIFGKLLEAGCRLGSSSLRPSSAEKSEVLRAISVPGFMRLEPLRTHYREPSSVEASLVSSFASY